MCRPPCLTQPKSWIAPSEPVQDIEQGKERAEEHAKEYLKHYTNTELPPLNWKSPARGSTNTSPKFCPWCEDEVSLARVSELVVMPLHQTNRATTFARRGYLDRTGRIGWLRAAVLGANDGILSTASLVLGVAAARIRTDHTSAG